ncbi:MAG: tRNA 4-thiouridine(8) synthase ThiI [Desulfobacterales bacterium]|nr:MAG: tRNA 4-thiouridine(8) synthase ThiI [Desulfobacterales bacterium]
MNQNKTTTGIKALGLCSGGLDSMLSALILQDQGIDVTWISFETPFFHSTAAKKASKQTGIPLIVKDITSEYMEMMRAPKAGFGKNMNPCMDCHALMFKLAGEIMKQQGFHFLFSGEVIGQRPKSQTKNALRWVEKHSGFDGYLVRPLSGKLLPETKAELEGLVDRKQLLDITGRGRKVQMDLAKKYGITEYPSPAGGCVLTDKGFSIRLRDLLYTQNTEDPLELCMLNHGRHFRLSHDVKLVVGRNKWDNKQIMQLYNPDCHIRLRHAGMPGPDAIFFGPPSEATITLAARITAGYTKAKPGTPSRVRVTQGEKSWEVEVTTPASGAFHDLLIPPPT